MTLIFDIETAPLSDSELREYCDPFDPSSIGQMPGEFDPSTVKCGNIGGPNSEKGKAKIEEARKLHEETRAGWTEKVKRSEAEYWDKIKNRAALSPETARVGAIGWAEYGGEINAEIAPESDLITSFWNRVTVQMTRGKEVVGFNSNHFDIPFLVRRSWILGIRVPPLFAYNNRLKPLFIDLLDVWRCGNYQDAIKLSKLASLLGVEGKYQGLDGSLFHELLAIDPVAAREYLVSDIRITISIFERLMK